MRTLFGMVCEVVGEYEKLVQDGGACGDWDSFVIAAQADPSDVCYELTDLFHTLFPDHNCEGQLLDICFDQGLKWVASIQLEPSVEVA